MEQQLFYTGQQGFCLRNKKSIKPQTVYTIFQLNGKQYKISVGARVMSQNWMSGKVKSRTKLDRYNNTILESKINQSKIQYNKMINYLCCSSVVTDVMDYDVIVSQFFKFKKMKTKKSTLYLTELLHREIQGAGENFRGSADDRLTKYHTHTVHEEWNICYAMQLCPKSLHFRVERFC